MQYVGIAIDEPRRLARLKENQVSLLAKYGYTEQMAMKKCREYDLVSPIYTNGTRGGCWFCPNAKTQFFCDFRRKHKELWDELRQLSKTPNLCSYGFKYGKTLQEVEREMNSKEFEQSNQLKLF